MNAEVIDLLKTVSKIIELSTRIRQPKTKQDTNWSLLFSSASDVKIQSGQYLYVPSLPNNIYQLLLWGKSLYGWLNKLQFRPNWI